jgi:hypothetical protein
MIPVIQCWISCLKKRCELTTTRRSDARYGNNLRIAHGLRQLATACKQELKEHKVFKKLKQLHHLVNAI